MSKAETYWGVESSSDRLTITQIRKWAKTFFERRGVWPNRESGAIFEADYLTWNTVDRCLKRGGRGLPGKSSLSQVLRAGGADIKYGPKKRPLTTKAVLEWADLHHMRTGEWPHRESGRVREAPNMTWGSIDRRLRKGDHSSGVSTTLIRLLRENRGVWDARGNARLTLKLILKWADAHYARTGRWPVTLSGPVHGVPNEKWVNVDMAMRNGRRGIGEKISLSQLLKRERDYQPKGIALTTNQIVTWAIAHCNRTSKWPSRKSGDVYGVPGLNWALIDNRLMRGGCGLPGGLSLAKLLATHRNGSTNQ